VAKSPEEATSVTLQECFSLYTRAEKLGQGEAWFCPACNRKQEVVTQMVLWTAPDVLIINLKRFRQSSPSASTCNKLSTAVEFPLEGFDMTPNMTHRDPFEDAPAQPTTTQNAAASTNGDGSTAASTAASNGLKMWNTLSASWRKSQRRSNRHSTQLPQLPQDSTTPSVNVSTNNNIYDLYAVCNHHGSDLQSGHYTATCKNPTDGHWYNFDDVHTRVVDKTDVVSVDAYILFYQRRQVQVSVL
jgi:ubiquitin carboxyl-terminal hydrolase 31